MSNRNDHCIFPGSCVWDCEIYGGTGRSCWAVGSRASGNDVAPLPVGRLHDLLCRHFCYREHGFMGFFDFHLFKFLFLILNGLLPNFARVSQRSVRTSTI